MKLFLKAGKTSLFFLLSFLAMIKSIFTQNSTSITSLGKLPNLGYDGIFGIGWGVFSIICSIIVGIIICIYGFSTVYSLVFYLIGFFVPVIMFLIMAFTPLETDREYNISENQTKNSYIVVRWLVFTLISVALFTLIIPFMKLWTTVLVPQRVDSRTQKEYLEKVEKMLMDKKIDNGDNKPVLGEGGEKGIQESIFNAPELLPLSNQFVPQNQQQDIEMAKIENVANKERKKRIGALKRRITNDEE